MRERTLIRAWVSPTSYRSTVVHTLSVAAALAELKRVDAIAPPLNYIYTRLDIEQWVVGEMGSDRNFTVDADGIRQLEGAA